MTDDTPPVLPDGSSRRVRQAQRAQRAQRVQSNGSDSGTPRARGGKSITRRPRLPFAVLITALIVGGLALLLVLNTVSAANELRRRDLASKDASVAAQVQELRNEVAASAAPARLAQAAAALGMVPANHPAFLVLGPDGSMRVMGRPHAAQGAPVALPTKKKTKKPSASKTTSSAKTTAAKSSATTSSTTRGRSTKTAARSTTPSSTPSRTPTPSPTPTPTPTPTVTLPGGDR